MKSSMTILGVGAVCVAACTAPFFLAAGGLAIGAFGGAGLLAGGLLVAGVALYVVRRRTARAKACPSDRSCGCGEADS